MPRRHERVFLIRMWYDGEHIGDNVWRGSIHDVANGRRRYITALADAAEFIADALRPPDVPGTESSPDLPH